ncbi:MAG: 3-dehydroquinate synthase [Alicyclobacillus sp. RIFOXYA1_FULL_53_8]|nr:MAG: 3-dehydroquinate synthase [Alicyclobacillus sp. RIFOXYA1_FULL_53_8]
MALGGGVVGDLAGFVAATYLRGIRFIQMPTTLLAHDSSIGGKVGINLARGKNLVGAFHPPMAVLYDVSALHSLPPREWQNGMAEVIKHTIIGNPSLFERLEANPLPLFPGADAVEQWLAEAIQVKINVVEQDEFEQETRMWLNLGHTVGHAVEQVSHYRLGHGEAVAIGMRVEAEIAAARGWLSVTDKRRIIAVLDQHGLPIRPPEFLFDEIVDALQVDKKHTNAGWTFVLPKSIGEVAIARDVVRQELADAWEVSLRERNV